MSNRNAHSSEPAVSSFTHLQSILRRGGFMTKWKGQAASCAADHSASGTLFSGSASALALGVALVTGPVLLGATAVQAACTAQGTAGNFVCSGPITGPQAPTAAADGTLTVTTGAGFSITATGAGARETALRLRNDPNDPNVTGGISFVDSTEGSITGGGYGIYANNYGSGALSITTTGTTTGARDTGIRARNSGTDLTINAVDTTGASNGIYANNFGSSALSITTTGTTTSTGDNGIDARNDGTDLTINAVDTTGGDYGIYAVNSGSGALSITTTGTTTGGDKNGIHARNDGTDLTINAVDTTNGYGIGIYANNQGSGETRISIGGTVSGEYGGYGGYAGTAISIITSTGQTELELRPGWGTSGETIADGITGQTRLIFGGTEAETLSEGAGTFELGDWDDGTGSPDQIGNEFFGFDADLLKTGTSTFRITDDIGSGPDFLSARIGEGVLVLDNATITMGAAATALRVASGATLGVDGISRIAGNLNNLGTINARNGLTDEIFTVSGDYVGGGTLLVDVDTATDAADTLVIAGTASGVTQVGVTNVSVSNPTGNDITVITVAGTATASNFVLAGGPLAAGAFDYDLEFDAQAFVLRSQGVNGTGAVYEAAPSVLGGFNRLSTLEQRVGQRQWAGGDAAGGDMQPSGAWLRFTGDRTDLAADTGTNSSTNSLGLQAGIDFNIEQGATGRWVLGVTGQYRSSNASVGNALGFGDIDSEGYGLGLTATWYGNNGTYFDAQGQVSWISSDFSSSAGGSLATDQASTAYALSAEVGHRFALSETATLIPQAQLVWGQVDGARFTDSAGNAVDLGSNSSTVGRLGLAYEYAGDNGTFYAIGNILRDFSDANAVDVAGATLNSNTSETWGEFGVGGSVAMNETTNFYGEVSYRQAFDNSDSNALAATAGISIKW